jgi:parvulin-like peptidyl-prolyl isomerase
MKKILICWGLFTILSTGQSFGEKIKIGQGKRVIRDKIVARVNGRNVLLSGLKNRIEKSGEDFSVEEAIDNELLFQKAVERKLLATELDVEKNIAAMKEARQIAHLSEEEFEKRLKEDGLTGKKYRQQLARILAIRNLRQLEISERIVVTTHEVENYHKANPEYSEDTYVLHTKIIPPSAAKTEKEAIKKQNSVGWIELDSVKKSELLSKMSFVSKMKEGEISKPVKVDQGFQFLKLVKKIKSHRKTLKERWVDIERAIQKEKMDKFEKDYVSELKKRAIIVYL